jgi:hypothetical protein
VISTPGGTSTGRFAFQEAMMSRINTLNVSFGVLAIALLFAGLATCRSDREAVSTVPQGNGVVYHPTLATSSEYGDMGKLSTPPPWGFPARGYSIIVAAEKKKARRAHHAAPSSGDDPEALAIRNAVADVVFYQNDPPPER